MISWDDFFKMLVITMAIGLSVVAVVLGCCCSPFCFLIEIVPVSLIISLGFAVI